MKNTMSRAKTAFCLCAVLLCGACAHDGVAKAQEPDVKQTVDSFLASQTIDDGIDKETAKSQGSVAADLNGDGEKEIILVWTTLGPTYWHNTLTVFFNKNGHYEPADSKQLKGEASLSSVKDGIIYVDQVVHAPDDPVCCPSIKEQDKYKWNGKTIAEVP